VGASYGEQDKPEKYLESISEELRLRSPQTAESVMRSQLDGYTEEEVFEDLRDHDEFNTSTKAA
jgi:hypothetical protein